jgi:hypothetical protein
VAISTAGVASLASAAAAIATTERTTTIVAASFGAVAGNMTHLSALRSKLEPSSFLLKMSVDYGQAYLVALSGLATAAGASAAKGAVARNVTSLATLVA